MSRPRCLRPLTALVLGGAGFVGRHAVAALRRRGWRVIVGSRCPARVARRVNAAVARCERREVHLERCLRPADWDATLAGADVVVNCVGILRQRGRETYARVHHLAPRALAAACRTRGLRLIHVSALALGPDDRSRFLTSKRAGERAVLASGAEVAIVRPSLLDGEGGYGARWLRRVANWPVHPLPVSAGGRIAVMDVDDLGECLAALCAPALPVGREIVELGGAQALTLGALLAALRTRSGSARVVKTPAWMARGLSHVCDAAHVTPFSFGHFELLARDNLPARNRVEALLGRPPRCIGEDDAQAPTVMPCSSTPGRSPPAPHAPGDTCVPARPSPPSCRALPSPPRSAP